MRCVFRVSRLAKMGISLGTAVAERLHSDYHSVAHCLLASLPVSELVTTNYDRLLEQAVQCAGMWGKQVVPSLVKQVVLYRMGWRGDAAWLS